MPQAITFNIADARWPTVRAAILNVHVKPTNPRDPMYVADETDDAWATRVLTRRFETMLTKIMRTADRSALVRPDPGVM